MSRICKECNKGTLRIIDCDDSTIEVQCDYCNTEYCIEPDGFDEGGLEWVEAMSEKQMRELEGE